MKKKLIISICIIAVVLILKFKFPIYFLGFWVSVPAAILAVIVNVFKIDLSIGVLAVIPYYLLLLIIYFLIRKNMKAKVAYLSLVILLQIAGSYFFEKQFTHVFGKIVTGDDVVTGDEYTK